MSQGSMDERRGAPEPTPQNAYQRTHLIRGDTPNPEVVTRYVGQQADLERELMLAAWDFVHTRQGRLSTRDDVIEARARLDYAAAALGRYCGGPRR